MGHADTLRAMGGAFVAAAFLARLGGRIGLPTIPLFRLAGILLGPRTLGFVLVEDALILAAVAAGAGLDARLAPFNAGYVLVLAVLGPVVAGRAHLLADALRAAGRRLPGTTAPVAVPGGGTGEETEADGGPVPAGTSAPSVSSPASGHAEAGR